MKTKKILALALAAVLLVAVSVAGTIAYLTANTGAVTNTFVEAGVSLILKEHELKDDGKTVDTSKPVDGNDDYKLVPGDVMEKDPYVTLGADSLPCWVFVEIVDEAGIADKYLNWTVDPAWEKVTGYVAPNGGTLYARKTAFAPNETDYILTGTTYKNGEIIVDQDALTTDKMEEAKTASLKFYAYACQSTNVATYQAAAAVLFTAAN